MTVTTRKTTQQLAEDYIKILTRVTSPDPLSKRVKWCYLPSSRSIGLRCEETERVIQCVTAYQFDEDRLSCLKYFYELTKACADKYHDIAETLLGIKK